MTEGFLQYFKAFHCDISGMAVDLCSAGCELKSQQYFENFKNNLCVVSQI